MLFIYFFKYINRDLLFLKIKLKIKFVEKRLPYDIPNTSKRSFIYLLFFFTTLFAIIIHQLYMCNNNKINVLIFKII